MKNILLVVTLFLQLSVFAQNFDRAIDNLSTELMEKLKTVGKKNIAVLDVTDLNKSLTIPGKYIADNIAVDMVNNPGYFQVVDRHHLDQIMKEAKLNSEGYIDEATAKQLGKLLAADALVTGTYTVLSDKIMLTLFVIDAETAKDIASVKKYLPLDNDACAVLGINCPDGSSGSSIANRGFNQPVQSNENYNNPATVTPTCATNNTGNVCFENAINRGKSVGIGLRTSAGVYWGGPGGGISVQNGQVQCFYNLPSGVYSYEANIEFSDYSEKGQVLVEQCKSKTIRLISSSGVPANNPSGDPQYDAWRNNGTMPH